MLEKQVMWQPLTWLVEKFIIIHSHHVIKSDFWSNLFQTLSKVVFLSRGGMGIFHWIKMNCSTSRPVNSTYKSGSKYWRLPIGSKLNDLEQKQDTGVSDRVWFKDFSRFRQNGKKEGLTWLNTGLTGKHGIGSKDELERYFQRYVR